MKTLAHLLLFLLCAAALAWAGTDPVRLSLVSAQETPQAGAPLRCALKFVMEKGWHIYSDKAGDIGFPPVATWTLPDGWTADALTFPPSARFETGGIVSYGYENTAYLPVTLNVPAGADVKNARVAVSVDLLACKDSCVPLTLRAELSFPQTPAPDDAAALTKTASASEPPASAPAWGWLFFSAILGGLILNVMPCVFPVIGLKVMGFVEQAGGDAGQARRHGLVFAAGVLVSLWALTAVLLLLRAGGAQLGWGFQLQSPGFTFLLTLLFFGFALSLTGVFEIGMAATGAGGSLTRREGFAGTFFSGVLAVVVATPCSAPFFAPVIGTALSLPALGAFALFTGVGIGLSLPYFVLCAFPALLRKLPRPGPWMETLRQIFGFLFFGTAAYLVWVLAGLTEGNEWALLWILGALVTVALAAWIYGRWATPERGGKARKTATVAALALLGLSVWGGWPAAPSHGGFVWEPYSAQKLEQLRAEGRTVWVDFTARWCVTCLTNKATLAASPKLRALIKEKNVALLKADWTNRDEAITRALADFGRASVPLNVLYLPGHKEPLVLPTVLTPDDLIEPLTQPAP